MTKGELLLLTTKSIPYPAQIKELDFDSEAEAIRFTWRGSRFRVSTDLLVETVGDGVLSSDNESILLQALLERTMSQTD